MKKLELEQKRAVYVVDGCRTPFLKAQGVGPYSASDLAVAAGRTLLMRQPFAAENLDEVIIGSALPGPDEANIARIVALRLGCGDKVPAFTVMRNCASGMQAIDSAALDIAAGRCDLVLAGGTEAMSHAPLLFSQGMANWLSQWGMTKNFRQRFRTATAFRLSFLMPAIALLQGLTDPIIGMNMGQTAEMLAYQFHLTREQLDEFAVESHQRLKSAYEQGWMEEVVPIIDQFGKVYTQDDGLRPDSSMEKLACLKPVFDKKFGMVTAGNSSQISDGACLLILASADAIEKYQLPVMGGIIDTQWAALNPAQMGLGPVHAATPIMQRHQLTPADFDCWEINEAFAAQVLACLAAWNDDHYCQTQLGLDKAMGAPSRAILNRAGGAIALGHPIGASGARIVLHVLESLKQTQGLRGMASICIGGGQGGAMYLEQMTKVKKT